MLSNEKWFGASAGFYPETIDQSLRFDKSSGAELSRTPSSASNRKTWTLSTWVKLSGTIDAGGSILFCAFASSYSDFIYFDTSDRLAISFGNAHTIGTNAVFRDTTNWFHVVVAVDVTESTATDRVKIYINGTQQTLQVLYSSFPPNQNYAWNNTVVHTIGGSTNFAGYQFDGYLAEYNFIDGTALTPSSFGETKNGVWIPKAISGLTYGTNGFRLTFADTSSLGDDTSGNGNDYSTSNLASTDVVLDSPTNNFCTYSNLYSWALTNTTLSEGNLKSTETANTFGVKGIGTIAVNSGKWYFETHPHLMGNANYANIGVIDVSEITTTGGTESNLGKFKAICYASYQGRKSAYGTGVDSSITLDGLGQSAYGDSWGATDIIGVALDIDNDAIYFSKNGTWQNSATSSEISAGTTTNSAYTGKLSGLTWTVAQGNGLNHIAFGFTLNAGQDPSFAGYLTGSDIGTETPSEGAGVFKYAPPTGFLALCSSNLPDTTLSPNKGVGFQADDHFNTITYTGDDASSRSLTGVGFQPDWIWYKHRSIGYGHVMYDSSRGTGENYLRVDGTIAEGAYNDLYGTLTSFDADGITIARGDASGTESAFFNTNGATVVGWNWKCGGTAPTKTYKVVVVSDSGNKYRFRNSADSATFAQSAVTLDLQENGTYTFDISDSSMSGHPLRFSTTSDGTHGGGSEYTTGVTTSGTAGSSGATVTITVASSAPTLYYYCSNHSGMGGQINTNTTFGQTNFDGSVLSVLQANTTAGFSIVKYIGSSGAQNVGHGLTQAPELLFVKDRDATSNWWTGTTVIDGSMDFLYLNSTSAGGNSSISVPTSTTFNVDGTDLNTTGNDKVAYCFHSVEGFSKFGSFTGNGSADGTFVYTGFRPAFVIIKGSSLVSEWYIWDSVRNPHNVVNATLNLTQSQSEYSGGAILLDFNSNGFKVRDTVGSWNYNGGTYIYMAFAEQPFKFSNAR